MGLTEGGFIYKLPLGATGEDELALYDAGQDRVDARLMKTIWVGDPGLGTTIQGAIIALNSDPVRLHVPSGVWDFPADYTIPSYVTLCVAPGATIAIPTTKTLTINGSIEAGLCQVFSCTGTGKVVFGSQKVVYPEWWGAVINAPATDCGLSLNLAIVALPNGGIIEFQSGTYHIGTKVNLANDLEFRGYGGMSAAKTILRRTADITMIDATGISTLVTPLSQIYRNKFSGIKFGSESDTAYSSDLVSLRAAMNFTFDWCHFTAPLARALFMWEVYDSRFNNCYITWSGNPTGVVPAFELKSSNATYGSTNNIYFTGCVWEQNYATALKVHGNVAGYRGNQIAFENCKVENIDLTGPALDFAGAYGIRFKNMFVAGSLNIALDELVKFDQCDDVEGDMLLIIGLGGSEAIQRIMTINTGAGTVQGRYNLFLSGINWDSIAEAAAVKIDSVTYSPWVNIKTYGPSPGNAGYQCSTKALTNFPYTSEALYGSSVQTYAPVGTSGDLMEVLEHALAVGGSDKWGRRLFDYGGATYQAFTYNTVERLLLYGMGYMQLIGDDFSVGTQGKGVRLTNAAGTVTKRVRLNDAGDGLIFEAP